ncbi:MAG: stage II sporulation protein M [Candidatus Nanoarchaeia archaeon]|nr:stage II sporulation protein M [Candidatus Nanoarchaeia archaeon]
MKKGVRKKKENWIYSNFKFSLRILIQSKNYVLFAFLLLLISTAFGFAFPNLFENQVLEIIKEILKQTEGLGTLEMVFFIIFNNLKSAFFGLIFGIGFGIVPFFMALSNGYVLGFVMNKSVLNGGILTLWKLFPHGVFEIPAVLISMGLGLRLGVFLFNKRLRQNGFKELVKSSLKIFLLIVIPLLVVAGIIEGLLIGLLK